MSSTDAAYNRSTGGRMGKMVLVILALLSLFPFFWIVLLIYSGSNGLSEGNNNFLASHIPGLLWIIFGAIAILFVLLDIIFLWRIRNKFFNPITDLTKIVELFLDGDWGRRAIVKGYGEVNSLSGYFNQLADHVQTLSKKTETNNSEYTYAFQTIQGIAHIVTTTTTLDRLIYECSQFLTIRLKLLDLQINLPKIGNLPGSSPGSSAYQNPDLNGTFEKTIPIIFRNETFGFLLAKFQNATQTADIKKAVNELELAAPFIATAINSFHLYKETTVRFDGPFTGDSTLSEINDKLRELETVNTVSRAIALETDVESLYRLVHEEITKVMGHVSFIIALYEPYRQTIEIPYMYEYDREADQTFENNIVQKISPFPLGEGLTSILIKTRQPLLLRENVAEEALRLGAKVVGKPAQSWLGVPLLVQGEPVGAMIVQDVEKEYRFDLADLNLLSSLANQVAIAIRNTRLVRELRNQVEQERLSIQIWDKVWSSTDVDMILQNALNELGRSLKASEGMISLDVRE